MGAGAAWSRGGRARGARAAPPNAAGLVPESVQEAASAAAARHLDALAGVGKVPCLVLEYADGGTLEQWVKARVADQGWATAASAPMEVVGAGATAAPTPVPWQWVVTLAFDAAKGVDYAHRKGIAHRDIKAGNFLVTGGGRVMLADLGLAKASAAGSLLCSTPSYWSPQLWALLQGERLMSQTHRFAPRRD